MNIYAILFALLMGFLGGWTSNGWRHEAGEKKAVEQVRKVEQTQQTLSANIASAVETQREQTRVVYRTINREVIKYVQSSRPADCRLDAEWVRLHNAAAMSSVPATASQPARSASATDAIVTVTGNYESCHETADRLRGLQSWVRAQQAIGP